MDVGYLEMILYYLLVVLTIAQISPFFLDNECYCICDLLWHFVVLRYTISELICISYMDVGHLVIILDYFLVVPSIVQISPIFWDN